MEAGHLRENPANSATTRNTSSNHLTLQKADGPSFSSKKSSHQTKPNNKKLTSTGFEEATDIHPACPNKEQNHLQNSLLRRTQFWVRKTFSKPASLKRASLVAFPVAISHKVCVDTKTLRFCNPDAKNVIKMNLNTVPKMGPPGGPIFGTACTA